MIDSHFSLHYYSNHSHLQVRCVVLSFMEVTMWVLCCLRSRFHNYIPHKTPRIYTPIYTSCVIFVYHLHGFCFPPMHSKVLLLDVINFLIIVTTKRGRIGFHRIGILSRHDQVVLDIWPRCWPNVLKVDHARSPSQLKYPVLPDHDSRNNPTIVMRPIYMCLSCVLHVSFMCYCKWNTKTQQSRQDRRVISTWH